MYTCVIIRKEIWVRSWSWHVPLISFAMYCGYGHCQIYRLTCLMQDSRCVKIIVTKLNKVSAGVNHPSSLRECTWFTVPLPTAQIMFPHVSQSYLCCLVETNLSYRLRVVGHDRLSYPLCFYLASAGSASHIYAWIPVAGLHVGHMHVEHKGVRCVLFLWLVKSAPDRSSIRSGGSI